MPRKRPIQARAQVTLDAIVDATGQLFERGGMRETTTTKVAERAGVSVGSLYQYFPDKKALLVSFFERRIAQDMEIMKAVVARGVSTPDDLIRVATEEMIGTYRRERALYRSVVEALPMMEGTDEVRAALAAAVKMVAVYLRTQPDLLQGRDPELVALVMFHSLRSSLNAVVAQAPEKLDAPELLPMLVGGMRAFLGRADS